MNIFNLSDNQFKVFLIIFLESFVIHFSNKFVKKVELNTLSNVLYRISIRITVSILAFKVIDKFTDHFDFKLNVTYFFLAIFALNMISPNSEIFKKIDSLAGILN